ncbi:MAG TPA: MMPL family transporter [Actinomycetota bacterium]|nr:MMPL family transporter [Actinomycetota bacterium]
MSENGERRRLFFRLGLFAHRRRWWVVTAWLLIFAAALPLLGKLSDRLSQGGFEVPGSQSARALELSREFRGRHDITSTLVVWSETGTVQDPEFVALFQDVRTALLAGPGVAEVTDPYVLPEQEAARYFSQDGKVLTAEVGLTDNQDQALRHAEDLNEIVAEASGGSTDVRALLTGDAPFYAAFTEITTHDLERAERIAFPLSLLILVLAFGSLVAAGLPLGLALLSLVVTFGAISLIAATTTVSIFTQNIASMIGIGVGIDYSLFLLTRFREELRAGRQNGDAVAAAMATSGKAVFVSALTVVVSLSGILLVDIAAIRSMGLGAMVAVAVACAAALTLLPALLSSLGPRVDKWAIFRRKRAEAGYGGGWWHRWATAVMRRPWTALILTAAIVMTLAFPALHLRLGSSGPDIFPEDATPRVAAEVTAEAFGEGQVSPVVVFLESDDAVELSAVAAMTEAISADPEVTRVVSLATVLPPEVPPGQEAAFLDSPQGRPLAAMFLADGGRMSQLTVVTKSGPQTEANQAFVERLRDRLETIVPEGTEAMVGGSPALNVDINREMESSIVPVVAMVLILSFLLLLLFFRSLLLPLKAIIMNGASVAVAYGLLVFVFQDGHFQELLGFNTAGHIEVFIPLFLFSILFGLSMDYEVFLLARIREEYLRTGDNTEAVGWGLEHTGRIITSAAAIMVTVFGAFAAASLVPIKAMGFGLAVAVLLDATLIRVVLVPASMRLMGKWNWWLPKWLDRILPRVSVEGEPPVVEAEAPVVTKA